MMPQNALTHRYNHLPIEDRATPRLLHFDELVNSELSPINENGSNRLMRLINWCQATPNEISEILPYALGEELIITKTISPHIYVYL